MSGAGRGNKAIPEEPILDQSDFHRNCAPGAGLSVPFHPSTKLAPVLAASRTVPQYSRDHPTSQLSPPEGLAAVRLAAGYRICVRSNSSAILTPACLLKVLTPPAPQTETLLRPLSASASAQDADLTCIIGYELPVSRAMAGGKRFFNLTRPRVLFILTQDTVRQTIFHEGSRNHRLSLL